MAKELKNMEETVRKDLPAPQFTFQRPAPLAYSSHVLENSSDAASSP